MADTTWYNYENWQAENIFWVNSTIGIQVQVIQDGVAFKLAFSTALQCCQKSTILPSYDSNLYSDY